MESDVLQQPVWCQKSSKHEQVPLGCLAGSEFQKQFFFISFRSLGCVPKRVVDIHTGAAASPRAR